MGLGLLWVGFRWFSGLDSALTPSGVSVWAFGLRVGLVIL